ncbi:MAG: rhomboid family intramembrane serine protease [Gemmatimonadales bacterium]|nr:rhomboid family intramembrane serine protease [Gemmatimonadales bacterium]
MALVPRAVLIRPWTPITYMFLHADFMHLAFNMLGLYFFGPQLELRLGGRKFLWLYFLAGITGAALSFIFTPSATIIGASGGVFGVFLGFAMFWPRERVYIFGILPMEAWFLVTVMTLMALYGGFTSARGGVAHFAHLGGFLGAFVYLRLLERTSPARRFKKRAASVPRQTGGNERANLERWSRIPRDSMHEVNRAEVDRLLEKVRAQGASSLTQSEREALDRFSPE